MIRLLIIIILIYASCGSKPETMKIIEFSAPIGWQKFEECGVSFYLPPTIKENTNVRGGDSCFREYQNSTIYLNIDNYCIRNRTDDSLAKLYSSKDEFHLEKILLNGNQAELITFKNKTAENSSVEHQDITVLHILNTIVIRFESETNEQRNNVFQVIQSVKSVSQ